VYQSLDDGDRGVAHMSFSHIDESGKAKMVDVSQKQPLKRTAVAYGSITMDLATIKKIQDNAIKKGDVLAVAKIAAIMAAKNTAQLIPLCHNLSLDSVDMQFEFSDHGIGITSQVSCVQKTGVEMEALVAVSIACLTIYDMCKAVDKKMSISDIHLVDKRKEPL